MSSPPPSQPTNGPPAPPTTLIIKKAEDKDDDLPKSQLTLPTVMGEMPATQPSFSENSSSHDPSALNSWHLLGQSSVTQPSSSNHSSNHSVVSSSVYGQTFATNEFQPLMSNTKMKKAAATYLIVFDENGKKSRAICRLCCPNWRAGKVPGPNYPGTFSRSGGYTWAMQHLIWKHLPNVRIWLTFG